MSTTSTVPTNNPTHLILVCCHAIYLSPNNPHHSTSSKKPKAESKEEPKENQTPNTEENWLLLPFQTNEPPTFTSHLQTGLRLLLTHPTTSLLILSGSATRPETPLSEASSYLSLAHDSNFFNLPNITPSILSKIILEEQALDSFGNLFYSLAAFWRETGGVWPEKVTIVTHEFKRERFLDVHVKTIRFPVENVEFIGINPDYMDPEKEEYDEVRTEDVRKGEKERGFNAWKDDCWGVGRVLRGKRRARNCWGSGQMLFCDDRERRRSGVMTKVLEADEEGGLGEEEVLNGRGVFPWEGI